MANEEMIVETLEALQIITAATRFFLPFSLAGRPPSDREIAVESERLFNESNAPEKRMLFTHVCRDIILDSVAVAQHFGRSSSHRPSSFDFN